MATREDSGVLCFSSRQSLTHRVRMECYPDILVVPEEDHYVLDTSLDEVYLPCSDSRATPSSPSQVKWKVGLPCANTRGSQQWQRRGNADPGHPHGLLIEGVTRPPIFKGTVGGTKTTLLFLSFILLFKISLFFN